jgi:hypothetical protein
MPESTLSPQSGTKNLATAVERGGGGQSNGSPLLTSHHLTYLLADPVDFSFKDDVTAILLIGTYFLHARKPWRCVRNAVHASSPQAASLKT